MGKGISSIKARRRNDQIVVDALAKEQDDVEQELRIINGHPNPLNTPSGSEEARKAYEIIGQEFPEVKGIDLFGNPMRLSQFRGSIVILDLWAYW